MTDLPKIPNPDLLPVNSAIVTYRRQRRLRTILLTAALLALLLSMLLLYRASASSKPWPPRTLQNHYACTYQYRPTPAYCWTNSRPPHK